jgi:hypothetical protein
MTTQLTTLRFWYESLSSTIELPVTTGDRACGLPSSSAVRLFLFRFPDPRPVVGTVFEGRISAIYTT